MEVSGQLHAPVALPQEMERSYNLEGKPRLNHKFEMLQFV